MKFKRITLIGILAALALAACGGEATPTETTVDILMTQGVATMVASYFDAQTVASTPATDTPPVTMTPFPSLTPFASPTSYSTPTYIYYTATLSTLTPGTPTVTGTHPTPTINPASLAYGCNNLAFIRDVTVPPGTVFQKGQDFTKTWKVQNIGTCPWMYQYRLMLVSGSDFGAGPTKLQRKVEVNDWAEISIQLGAPKQPGTYASYWRLADADGHMFGATLVVSFVVVEPPTPVPATAVPTVTPTATFAVTETPTITLTP